MRTTDRTRVSVDVSDAVRVGLRATDRTRVSLEVSDGMGWREAWQVLEWQVFDRDSIEAATPLEIEVFS